MKQVLVKSGEYKGATAVILGMDADYLKHSIFGENSQLGNDYMIRLSQSPDHWTLGDKVFIANINGNLVALNENELKDDPSETKVLNTGKKEKA